MRHNERTLYSLLSSVVGQLTPVHLSEYSFVERRSDEKRVGRRMDLWCNYRTVDFGIELKRIPVSVKNLRNHLQVKALVGQAANLRRQVSGALREVGSWGGSGTICAVGVQVVYIWAQSKKRENLKGYKQFAQAFAQRNLVPTKGEIRNFLEATIKPDWASIFWIPEEMRTFELDNKKWEYNPAVVFAATVRARTIG
ncbi:MAG: hypothetical protein AB7P12_01325 [Alphaproteobacteria bacterium]